MTQVRTPEGFRALTVPTEALLNQVYSFYQDDLPTLGTGTYAESFPVPQNVDIPAMRLSYVGVRWELPFSAGESAIIRLFRFRKPAPFGPFTLSQITDAFVANDTLDWSWTYDISANIRSGFDLNPLTDSVAVSNVYVAGGTPNVRAFRVDFAYEAIP